MVTVVTVLQTLTLNKLLHMTNGIELMQSQTIYMYFSMYQLCKRERERRLL